MREIKFKAWLVNERKMVDVINITFVHERIVIEYEEEHYFYSTTPEDIILLQFTGLYDRNGTPIYEGDIVETIGHNGNKKIEIVKYSEGCFNVGYHYGSSTKRSPMLLHPKKIKVLGNIYENEKLLGGE